MTSSINHAYFQEYTFALSPNYDLVGNVHFDCKSNLLIINYLIIRGINRII